MQGYTTFNVYGKYRKNTRCVFVVTGEGTPLIWPLSCWLKVSYILIVNASSQPYMHLVCKFCYLWMREYVREEGRE